MSNTKSYAEREIDILIENLKKEKDSSSIEEFKEEILSLYDKFSNSGQSGGSAPYTAEALAMVIKNLCLQKPISPIYNTEDEWMQVGGNDDETPMNQNNRLYALFKDGKDGKPYYLNAIVWKGEDQWDQFTGTVEGYQSRQYVKQFPFVPKTFYIDVYKEPFNEEIHKGMNYTEDNDGSKYTYKIKVPSDIEKVFEYYDDFNKK